MFEAVLPLFNHAARMTICGLIYLLGPPLVWTMFTRFDDGDIAE